MMTTSGNWSGPPDHQNQSDEDDDSNTSSELDVQIDHFSEYSMDSLDDVLKAIKATKKSILETEEITDARKDLVKRLIQLQIRRADLEERKNRSVQALETRGHVFVNYQDSNIPGVTNAKKIYCQVCGGGIWIYLQSSQHCQDCGYSIHLACMDSIMRECVAIKVRTQPDFIMEICPEVILPVLKYRCVECDGLLSSVDPMAEPRLCDYTGLSFCPRCHWNAQSFTPARIVHNWDFEPRAVSQATKQYLFLMFAKPVINIERVNPKLFAAVQELNHVFKLRSDIMLMKKYLVVCRIAMDKKLLLRLADRQHFVDSPDYWSLKDLVDVKSGTLLEYLQDKVSLFTDHIRSCVLCRAKGFICEICDFKGEGQSAPTSTILFPFDEMASSCPDCEGVFHRDCYRESSDCPRCARKKQRKEGEESEKVKP